MEKTTLLINHIYWENVGHAVEALKFAKGFYDANDGLEITVLLNKQSPVELADACDWITRAYAIDTREVGAKGLGAPCFEEIPRVWDYVLANDLIVQETRGRQDLGPEQRDFLAWSACADQYFAANRWQGSVWDSREFPASLGYKGEHCLDMRLPRSALEFAQRYQCDGHKFVVMLAGSASVSNYPSIDAWIDIIGALNAEFKQACIYVTGVYESVDGRTATTAYGKDNVQRIFDAFDNVIDCYGIGLWNQLALVRQADVFISPHTGFGSLAPCVGTPWLAISGREYNEYVFNDGMPFYSVLPDCERYPCHHYGIEKACLDRRARGEKILCMDSQALDQKIPEILEGVRLLLSNQFTYVIAKRLYKERFNRHLAGRAEIGNEFFTWPCWWQPHGGSRT